MRRQEDESRSSHQAVQRVSDTAKGVAQRIGGIAPVALEDNEKTFPDLFNRIQKTIDILEGVKVRFVFLLIPLSNREGQLDNDFWSYWVKDEKVNAVK